MENKTSTQKPQTLSDFFAETESNFEPIKLLGFDHYPMDSGTDVMRVYSASTSDPLSNNKFGIIPMTYNFTENCLLKLKEIKEFPTVIHAKTRTIAGKGNSNTDQIFEIQ